LNKPEVVILLGAVDKIKGVPSVEMKQWLIKPKPSCNHTLKMIAKNKRKHDAAKGALIWR